MEVSDEELKEIRNEVINSIDDEIDEYTEEEIEDVVNDAINNALWNKFHDARKNYEVTNRKDLIDMDDRDVEEI